MDDHLPVTPPGGTGDDDDADGPSSEAPADGPPAGDTGRPRESSRPEGYEPL